MTMRVQKKEGNSGVYTYSDNSKFLKVIVETSIV